MAYATTRQISAHGSGPTLGEQHCALITTLESHGCKVVAHDAQSCEFIVEHRVSVRPDFRTETIRTRVPANIDAVRAFLGY